MKSRAVKVTRNYLIVISIGVLYTVICRYTGFRIECPINAVTGLLCPGCGVTRMMLAISEFDFKEAFYYNPVVFCILPILLYLKIKRSYQYIKYGEIKTSKIDNIMLFAMLFALIVFGIIRNII